MTHPVNSLDDLVHQRTRLGILAILHETGSADFSVVRDQLVLTDGNLSQHMRVLEAAELITVEKGFSNRRPRTSLRITRLGRQAFTHEMDILTQLVSGADKKVPRPRTQKEPRQPVAAAGARLRPRTA